MLYEWLLFDADGTLFDYDLAEAAALKATFAEMGLAWEDDYRPVYADINHQLWLAFERGDVTQVELRVRRFASLLAALGLQADAAEMSRRYLPNLGRGAFLIDGAADLLAASAGRYRLALITNGLTDVQRPRLALSGLAAYFEHVIISEEVGSAKPQAAIFDHTMNLLGAPPRQKVLIVGDSLSSDMRGGSDYGLATCWYNPARKERPAEIRITHEIHRLKDLWPLLDL